MSLTKITYSMLLGAPVNVLDFGALGDGVNDDTAAIQNAIDAVSANGGGAVYVPPGSYNITSTLVAKGNCSVFSDSFRGAVFNFNPTVDVDVMIEIDDDYVTLDNISFVLQNTEATTGSVAIKCKASRFMFSTISIVNCTFSGQWVVGFYADQTTQLLIYSHFNGCRFVFNDRVGTGVFFRGNSCSIRNSRFATLKYAMSIQGSTVSIEDNAIESNGDGTNDAICNINLDNGDFANNYLEDNVTSLTGSEVYCVGSQVLDIYANLFNSVDCTNALYFDAPSAFGVPTISVRNNRFLTTSGAQLDKFIASVDSDAGPTIICSGNEFYNKTTTTQIYTLNDLFAYITPQWVNIVDAPFQATWDAGSVSAGSSVTTNIAVQGVRTELTNDIITGAVNAPDFVNDFVVSFQPYGPYGGYVRVRLTNTASTTKILNGLTVNMFIKKSKR